MYKESIETVIIGAGVVGLAIARVLAMKGHEVLVLEEQKHIGTGISSRNSEVIHAGIYYPQNSLKAKLCVRGKELLYQYAAERSIDHQKCGKIIVATEDTQLSKLEDIHTKAKLNGVEDLQKLSATDCKLIEPDIQCAEALLSPSTGIFDSHSLMLSLQSDLENNGGSCVFLTSVQKISSEPGKIVLHVKSQEEDIMISAENLINSAGLNSVNIAKGIESFPTHCLPTLRYAKGNYFSLTGKNPFKRLVYPVPEEGGLGVHLTMDLSGRARFGPDFEWVNTVDYEVKAQRADHFYDSIRSYWPNLPDNSLVPDYAGIRPKIYWAEQKEEDFVIQNVETHRIPGLINLFGIESPGLTSSLAIAEYVADML